MTDATFSESTSFFAFSSSTESLVTILLPEPVEASQSEGLSTIPMAFTHPLQVYTRRHREVPLVTQSVDFSSTPRGLAPSDLDILIVLCWDK